MKTAAAQLEALIQEFLKVCLDKETKFTCYQHALLKKIGVPKDSCWKGNNQASSTNTA